MPSPRPLCGTDFGTAGRTSDAKQKSLGIRHEEPASQHVVLESNPLQNPLLASTGALKSHSGFLRSLLSNVL